MAGRVYNKKNYLRADSGIAAEVIAPGVTEKRDARWGSPKSLSPDLRHRVHAAIDLYHPSERGSSRLDRPPKGSFGPDEHSRNPEPSLDEVLLRKLSFFGT